MFIFLPPPSLSLPLVTPKDKRAFFSPIRFLDLYKVRPSPASSTIFRSLFPSLIKYTVVFPINTPSLLSSLFRTLRGARRGRVFKRYRKFEKMEYLNLWSQYGKYIDNTKNCLTRGWGYLKQCFFSSP